MELLWLLQARVVLELWCIRVVLVVELGSARPLSLLALDGPRPGLPVGLLKLLVEPLLGLEEGAEVVLLAESVILERTLTGLKFLYLFGS